MGIPEREPASGGTDRRPEPLNELFSSFLVGEFARTEGSGTAVQAYELMVDPADATERRGLLLNFCARAAALGYQEAFPSVTLQNVGFREPNGQRPLTAVYFFLEPPSQTT